jgi:hypothetical protein
MPWCSFGSQRDTPATCASGSAKNNYFEAVLFVPCGDLGSGPICFAQTGTAAATESPCRDVTQSTCPGVFMVEFGYGGVVPLSFDSNYNLNGGQGSPASNSCASEYDADPLGGPCPYVNAFTAGTYPPLPTTPG